VVVVANRRKRFVLLPGLLWRRCISSAGVEIS
jgi:hypothetical protein